MSGKLFTDDKSTRAEKMEKLLVMFAKLMRSRDIDGWFSRDESGNVQSYDVADELNALGIPWRKYGESDEDYLIRMKEFGIEVDE